MILFDKESERHVNAHLLLDPEHYVPAVRDKGLTPDDFVDDTQRELFCTVCESYDNEFTGELKNLGERVMASANPDNKAETARAVELCKEVTTITVGNKYTPGDKDHVWQFVTRMQQLTALRAVYNHGGQLQAMADRGDLSGASKLLSDFVHPSIHLGEMDGRTNGKSWFDVWKPSKFIGFTPPDDFVLVGDCHLVRGGLSVLGGAPGVGKSRAGIGLAIAGATGSKWMGYDVHAKFKTLILQCENGEFRLKNELTDIKETVGDTIRDPRTTGSE